MARHAVNGFLLLETLGRMRAPSSLGWGVRTMLGPWRRARATLGDFAVKSLTRKPPEGLFVFKVGLAAHFLFWLEGARGRALPASAPRAVAGPRAKSVVFARLDAGQFWARNVFCLWRLVIGRAPIRPTGRVTIR